MTVLNFAIPLNLFYRMHSVASLFEVFRRVWQNSWWLSMTENMHWDTCHDGLPSVSHSAGQLFRRQSGSHSSRLESKLQRQTKCWCLSEGITDRWTYVSTLLEDLSHITWCLFKMVMKRSFVFFCPVITFELIFLSGVLCKVYMLYLKRTFSTALN